MSYMQVLFIYLYITFIATRNSAYNCYARKISEMTSTPKQFQNRIMVIKILMPRRTQREI